MGVLLLLILLTIFLSSVLIIYKVTSHRERLTEMTGMVIAMSISMSVGLTFGVIIGILLSDNFFAATVLGMIVGLVVGFMAGIPIGIIAVLDGMLSGIMGGMMGAMLGEMITIEYQNAIVKIMFFLFLCILLILLYFIQKEVKQKDTAYYTNPLFTIILFGLIVFIFNHFGPIFTDVKTPNYHNHIEHHSDE